MTSGHVRILQPPSSNFKFKQTLPIVEESFSLINQLNQSTTLDLHNIFVPKPSNCFIRPIEGPGSEVSRQGM